MSPPARCSKRPASTRRRRKILEAICASLGWEHGALWSVDREADVLRCSEIWTAPGVALPRVRRHQPPDVTFARGVGLPGRVWATGEPAWIPDVVRDANFPRARRSPRAKACTPRSAFPVLLRGEVLGVMEFFSREIREPDEELLSMLATVGNQIGHVHRSAARAGGARSLLHALARHAVRRRLRRLLQAGQSRLAAHARLHRSRSCCRGRIWSSSIPTIATRPRARSQEADATGSERASTSRTATCTRTAPCAGCSGRRRRSRSSS